MRMLVIVIAALMLVAAPASAKPHHRHPVVCKKTQKRVRRHGKVRCIKKRTKPSQPSPVAAPRTKLHAHLDPSYTRDPMNPFKVTYAYSASASAEVQSQSLVADEPAVLPSGVLSLYSDGRLECAINVGSGVEDGECPVMYGELGAHRVTTIYTSGEQSATATETEVIEPLATTTTLQLTYADLPGGPERLGTDASPNWRVGEITAQAHVSTLGAALITGPAWLPVELDGTIEIPVLVESNTNGHFGPEPTCEEIREGYEAKSIEWPVPIPASGASVTAHSPTRPGYTASEASEVFDFNPTMPCGGGV